MLATFSVSSKFRGSEPANTGCSMGRQKPKQGHKPNKDKRRAWKTKRRTKDLDQIYAELQQEPKALPIDHDLPGKGKCACRFGGVCSF